MAKITRYGGNFKAFGSDATGTERTVFGSTTQTDDLTTNLGAEYQRGWGVLPSGQKPPKQYFNGALFGTSQAVAYLHQAGVAEWNGEQEYHAGSITNRNGQIFVCLKNNHVSASAPETDSTNWRLDDGSVATISALLNRPTVGTVNVLNYHTGLEGGGGIFYWDASKPKSEHNGGTVIDPTVVYPTDWSNQTQLGTWFDTANAGTGCWVRQYDGAVDIRWFGASKESAAVINKYVKQAETLGYPYLYLPAFDNNYVFDSSVKLNFGDFRIFGDSAQKFFHPFTDGRDREFRKGVIEASVNNTDSLFNLGNYNTSTTSLNLATAYVMSNLSFVNKNPYTSTYAIDITANQNGPDRPLVFKDLSAYKFKAGLHLAPKAANVSIQMANLRVSDCTFSFGDKAIHCEGEVYGANISNNNFEANSTGCIWGNFNQSVVINNNMLENSQNPINLTPTAGLRLKSFGNYFEYHPTSDYIYRVKGTNTYLIFDIDISSDIGSGGIPDYPVLLEGAGRFTVDSMWKVLLKPNVSNGMVITSKSQLFEKQALLFSNLTKPIVCAVDNFEHMTDSNNAYIHNYPTINTVTKATPVGDISLVSDFADGILITAGESIEGKLLVTNLLIKGSHSFPFNSTSRAISAKTPGGAYVAGPGALLDFMVEDCAKDGWKLVSIVWRGINNVADFILYCEEALRGYIEVAGATTKVLGVYPADGSNSTVISVTPAMVNKVSNKPIVATHAGGWTSYKYPDGKLVLELNSSLSLVDTTTTTVQGLSVYTNINSVTFPIVFTETPRIFPSVTRNFSFSLGECEVADITTSAATFRTTSLTSFVSYSGILLARVEGKWK